ncbi:MAG: response regulator [Candidatus Omnitrophica bacterium]|nr:response regulator [Candidatus Omnitrophota bacterium]
MIKVLLVDDDPEMRTCVGGFLKSRGFQVSDAKTGEEAIKLVKEESPDSVLLDIHLSQGISGIDVLKQIKEINQNIKVLMVTGFIDHEKEAECMNLGANGYIMKPINFPELDNTLRNSIGKR